jgi:hypothetical protein
LVSAAIGERVEALDQVDVVARRFRLGRLQRRHDHLDRVEAFQDERHGLRRDQQLPVPEAPEDILRRVRHPLQPGQAEEAAGALDGVDQPEDVAQQARIVRILLETDQFHVEDGNVLRRLRQELAQQIIHRTRPILLGCRRRGRTSRPTAGIRTASSPSVSQNAIKIWLMPANPQETPWVRARDRSGL